METKQILETIRMVEEENLDIRTITMGISLLDCIDASTEKTCQNIYNKITSKAKNLVKVGDEIASEFGIPIINKRISVTPIAIVASASGGQDCVAFARVLDKAAKAVGINFIGGYSALVEKGYQGAMENPKEGAKILHNYASDYEQSFLDASQEFLSKNYTDDPAKWGMMDAKVWDNYTDFMKENGLIKEKVSAKELFTNQFIE